MTVEIIYAQSPRKYGTGLGSNWRPLDLQLDSLLTVLWGLVKIVHVVLVMFLARKKI